MKEVLFSFALLLLIGGFFLSDCHSPDKYEVVTSTVVNKKYCRKDNYCYVKFENGDERLEQNLEVGQEFTYGRKRI